MPSPNNVTELIIFAVGAAIVVALAFIGSRYTKFGKRFTGDWRPGPIDITAAQAEARQHKREKYVDPLARIRPVYIIPPALLVMLLLFVYYFSTKQTWQGGN